MSNPFLHEDAEWKGSWWLPEDPDNKHAGFLRYSAKDGLSLTLVGGFDSMILKEVGQGGVRSYHGENRDFPVIHGLAGNREITLLDAHCLCSRIDSLGVLQGQPSEQTIRAEQALVGAHVAGQDKPVFDHANFCIEETWWWSGTSAMTAKIDRKLSGDATIELRPVDKMTADVGEANVILAHELTLPTFDHMRSGTRCRVEDKPAFSVRPRADFSLTDVIRYMIAIQDLLALATGRSPAILWITLYLPRPDRDQPESDQNRPREVHAYFRQRGSGDPDSKAVDAREMVFTLDDIPFEKLLPRWWHVRERFQAPCNILIGARYTTEPYVETSVITAVAAAEAFHNELDDEPAPIPQEELEDLIRRAVEAMPEDRKAWIRNVIPRGHSLKQRLDRLAERLPGSCRERLLPNPTVWAQKASRARNDLSHSGKSKANEQILDAVMRVTRAVVLVNILCELGMPEKRILKALTDNRELKNACERSRDYLAK